MPIVETLIVNDSEKLNGFVDWTNGNTHTYFLSNCQAMHSNSFSFAVPNCICHWPNAVDHFSRQRFLETWKILVTKLHRTALKDAITPIYIVACICSGFVFGHFLFDAASCQIVWIASWNALSLLINENEIRMNGYLPTVRKRNSCSNWILVVCFSIFVVVAPDIRFIRLFFYSIRSKRNIFSMWFDAKSIDGLSHFMWAQNIMANVNVGCYVCVRVSECDYFCSLFTSSRYRYAWMTSRHIRESAQNKTDEINELKRHLLIECACLCEWVSEWISWDFARYTVHRTYWNAYTWQAYSVYVVPSVRLCTHGSRIRTLCPIIFIFRSLFFPIIPSFLLYAIHIIHSFYNN